ncbi:hypothetical protein GCM10010307_21470 [Streptomyces vastus]|uniref:Uncharacterized protein n=1 Tax=Streptomyces vastus TaxID=285451 RepID=A0ABN3QM81_9ACTN
MLLAAGQAFPQLPRGSALPHERIGRDFPQAVVAGAGLLGVEEAGGVAGRQGDGQVPNAVLVRRPDRLRP